MQKSLNMQVLPLAILSLALVLVLCVSQSSQAEVDAYAKNRVTPELIPQSPAKVIKVVYPQSGNTQVDTGKVLDARLTSATPAITFEHEEGQLYSLFMLDLDGNADSKGNLLNLLVVNIPSGASVNRGQVLADYVAPTPDKGSSPHRVVFLAFKQTGGKIKSSLNINKNTINQRLGFNLKAFVQEHGLDSKPVAGNLFLSQFDCSVYNTYNRQLRLNKKLDPTCELNV